VQTNTRLRQRRSVLVQMKSETDVGLEPCMTVTENEMGNGAVLGPYVTTCAYAAEGRGCYDVQMTDRDVRTLEFSICMQSANAGGGTLFQYGKDYEPAFTYAFPAGVGTTSVNNCEPTYLWNQAVTIEPPKNIVYSGGYSELCIGYLSVSGVVYLRGRYITGSDSTTEMWKRCNQRVLEADDSTRDIVVTKILGFYGETGFALVLDEAAMPYMIETMGASPDEDMGVPFYVEGSHVALRFYRIAYYDSGQVLCTEANPTVLLEVRLGSNVAAPVRLEHPNGLSWVDACFTGTDGRYSLPTYDDTFGSSIMAVDTNGDLWAAGLITESMGIPYDLPGVVQGSNAAWFLPVLTKIPGLFDIVAIDTFGEGIRTHVRDSTGTVWAGGKKYTSTGLQDGVELLHRLPGRYSKVCNSGYNTVLGLHVDGTLWVWGRLRELTAGVISLDAWYSSTPGMLSLDTDWTDISGHVQGCGAAIRTCSTGSVTVPYGTESDMYNMFFTQDDNNFIGIATKGVKDVSVASRYALFVNPNNVILLDGIPSQGALGQYADSSTTYKQPMYNMPPVQRVWAFTGGSAFLDMDGKFFITGDLIPVIGAYDTYGYSSYVEVPFSSPVRECFLAGFQSTSRGVIVHLNNGSVYVWGSNEHGRLGAGGVDWVEDVTALSGLYSFVSNDYDDTAAVSNIGSVYVWGTTLPWEANTPTKISPVPINMSQGPQVFKEAHPAGGGLLLLVDEDDTNFAQYNADGFMGPRWAVGDVWAYIASATGFSYAMSDGYTSLGDNWVPIIHKAGVATISNCSIPYFSTYESFSVTYTNMFAEDPRALYDYIAHSSFVNNHDCILLNMALPSPSEFTSQVYGSYTLDMVLKPGIYCKFGVVGITFNIPANVGDVLFRIELVYSAHRIYTTITDGTSNDGPNQNRNLVESITGSRSSVDYYDVSGDTFFDDNEYSTLIIYERDTGDADNVFINFSYWANPVGDHTPLGTTGGA
jgi:hypothetical protein